MTKFVDVEEEEGGKEDDEEEDDENGAKFPVGVDVQMLDLVLPLKNGLFLEDVFFFSSTTL